MKIKNDVERKDDKRTWSAPKVERRDMIDRTQSAPNPLNVEAFGYHIS